MSALAASLLERIKSRRARTGVVGSKYVGLPLAVELAKAGFHDRDRSRRTQDPGDCRRPSPFRTFRRPMLHR